MPAHVTTVPEYCALLQRSKLVTESEVGSHYQKFKSEAGGSDADVEGFRKYLVLKKLVTDYQAALIQRGHADGFFIGGYVILDRLGKGASAGVYKAVHDSGQLVALKVLPASRAKNPKILSRFQREGRLLCQLDHPNVVRAYQVGQAGNVHFIVMEHVEGETLDEVLARRKKLPLAESVRLVYQALLGLQHLHEKRMVHRDLKPANLMVTLPPPNSLDETTSGTVKILDIGIGREMFSDDSPETRDLELTSEGTLLGTPDYLAPEQARDARTADIRADIYSLGCVLFHLIAGRPPFAEKNVMALMVKHATEKLPPLSEVTVGVPPGLPPVFERLTAKKADERFSTPAEAAIALRPFLPAANSTWAATPVLPAFEQWLATESGTEPSPVDIRKTADLPASAPPPTITPGTKETPKLPASPRRSPPSPPAAKSPPPPPPRPVIEEKEIDVELVQLPTVVPAEEARSLFDLSRRDFIMLGMGGLLVGAAVALGVGLAGMMNKRAPASDVIEKHRDGTEPVR